MGEGEGLVGQGGGGYQEEQCVAHTQESNTTFLGLKMLQFYSFPELKYINPIMNV